MHPEICLLDESVRPSPGDEFLLADDLAGAFDQSDQNVECPTAEPNGALPSGRSRNGPKART
jgi:hypothetical protein